MAHTIAIVGGGFSGTLTAVHLLRGEWPGGLHVVLVNRSGPLARGVAYVPGSAFFADAPKANTLRLSFVTVSPAAIDEGIAALAAVVKESL